GSHGSGRSALYRPASECIVQIAARTPQCQNSFGYHGPDHGGQHKRRDLRGDRIFLWRPIGHKTIDEPSRSFASSLWACGKVYSDSDPGRGLPGLSIDRRRRAPATLVRLRAPPVDRPHLVVEPLCSTHSPTTCPRWRSVMRTTIQHAISV